MLIPLKKKHRTGQSFKSNKASSSNSGHSKKNARGGGPSVKDKTVKGVMVKLDNYGKTMYCAATGSILPTHGMVVEYQGQLYSSRKVIV